MWIGPWFTPTWTLWLLSPKLMWLDRACAMTMCSVYKACRGHGHGRWEVLSDGYERSREACTGCAASHARTPRLLHRTCSGATIMDIQARNITNFDGLHLESAWIPPKHIPNYLIHGVCKTQTSVKDVLSACMTRECADCISRIDCCKHVHCVPEQAGATTRRMTLYNIPCSIVSQCYKPAVVHTNKSHSTQI
jgi:hypothetical protein